MFCRGGLLYLTSHRVLFRAHKLDTALFRADDPVDLQTNGRQSGRVDASLAGGNGTALPASR